MWGGGSKVRGMGEVKSVRIRGESDEREEEERGGREEKEEAKAMRS